MNEMLCIDEVGVDLELCVHAHGNDVDRLGSFLQNYCKEAKVQRNARSVWPDRPKLS
jgi:hypothetical protein